MKGWIRAHNWNKLSGYCKRKVKITLKLFWFFMNSKHISRFFFNPNQKMLLFSVDLLCWMRQWWTWNLEIGGSSPKFGNYLVSSCDIMIVINTNMMTFIENWLHTHITRARYSLLVQASMVYDAGPTIVRVVFLSISSLSSGLLGLKVLWKLTN